jgi:hypothetical protein
MHQPPLVPDVMLSLDVQAPPDLRPKQNRSYFVWEYGKPPDVVIEIVSNQKGGESGDKMKLYERIRVLYYAIFDPFEQLSKLPLRLYELQVGSYVERADVWLEKVGLGLKLWRGVYEEMEDQWLRWCDGEAVLIPTGAERAEQERQRAEQEQQRAEQERQRAEQERQRAEQEHQRAEQERQRAEQEHQRAEQERQRAEQEHQRAEQERQRAERLAARLRELGIDPNS